MRFIVPSILFYLVCAFGAGTADAQAINRCRDKSDKIIYTDKKCEDIDAVSELRPKPAAISVSVRFVPAPAPRGSALSLRGALEIGDINRAAGLFLWGGNDTAQANKRLDQLNTGELPVVDISGLAVSGNRKHASAI